jgi:hypothetical protein
VLAALPDSHEHPKKEYNTIGVLVHAFSWRYHKENLILAVQIFERYDEETETLLSNHDVDVLLFERLGLDAIFVNERANAHNNNILFTSVVLSANKYVCCSHKDDITCVYRRIAKGRH